MPKHPQQIAKLSRPRLHDALPRERLFGLLDDKRVHPALWVVGQPGAGKTTLVGSYLHARGLRALWYQADREDRDVFSFFYFLTQAAVAAKRGTRRDFPRLSSDEKAGIAAFSRAFFRELFLRVPGVVVLDNFQEIEDEPAIVQALAAGIPEIPQGSCLIVISRSDPAAGLAGHSACQRLAQIGPRELCFDREETRAMLGRLGDSGLVDRLHAGCDGWAAGLVLMREAFRRGDPEKSSHGAATPSIVFDYFASQVFERLDEEAKAVMLHTALLPYTHAGWASALTGVAEAAEVVESLYRRHLFIHRHPGGSYQYHALFREFLLSRAQAQLGVEGIQRTRERGATLLEKAGDHESAFWLRVASGDWVAARRIAGERAEALLAAGRWRALLNWLEALRPMDFEADAWLVYWHGLAKLATEAAPAREILEQAYTRFVEAGSRTGQLQSLAQILGSYFLAWDTVDSMDPWIDAMEAAIRDSRPASEDAIARAHASLVVALLYRQPCNPLLHVGARMVTERLEDEPDPTQKLRMAIFLAHYHDIMGELAKAARALAVVERLIAQPETDPLTTVVACMRCAHHHITAGANDKAVSIAERALKLAREHEFSAHLRGFLTVCLAHALLNAGETGRARVALDEARRLVDIRHRMIAIYLYWCEFWCAALARNRSRLRVLWAEFAQVPPAGVPINTAYNLPVVWFLVEEGRVEEARTRIVRWREALAGMGSSLVDFNLDVMEAYVELRAGGRKNALTALRRAFGTAAARGFSNTLSWMPDVMSELCAIAMENDIESAFVRALIRERGLAAPDPTIESWPWRVRIHALGRFDVVIEDRVLGFSGRPQHRTLELLKALVALGGQAVSAARITELLWRDADGDAAHRAFSVALHRLRKLLGSEESVRLRDGRLSLNGEWCWVDATLFESLTASEEAPVDDAAYLRLCALYRGPLLDGDDAAWIVASRQTLQARFLRATRLMGARMEERDEPERAVAVYRGALEKDPLCEDLYRRIMMCCQKQGQIAEAMEAYRRCREILSIVLGIAPSAQTQALFHSLQATHGTVMDQR